MSTKYSEVQITFNNTVQPGQGIIVTKSYSKKGKITSIILHFPSGCNQLVEVALQKDGKSFYPANGYIALDDATPVMYVDADYYQNEPLTFEVLNKDAVNAHAPTCTVTIRYEVPSWDT